MQCSWRDANFDVDVFPIIHSFSLIKLYEIVSMNLFVSLLSKEIKKVNISSIEERHIAIQKFIVLDDKVKKETD